MTPSSARAPSVPNGYRIDRALLGDVEQCLDQYGGAFVSGPYEVGKSELAREIARRSHLGAILLDASDNVDRARIVGPENILREPPAGLVVIDQLQSCPEAADIVRQQIDAAGQSGAAVAKFLLLGSHNLQVEEIVAARIGTRIARFELAPIDVSELYPSAPQMGEARLTIPEDVDEAQAIVRPNTAIDLETLWLRGGFPGSLFANDEARSFAWRVAYIDRLTYKGYRTIAPQMSASSFRDFLGRLAAGHGEPFTDKAKGIQQTCIDHLRDLGLVRQLAPWSTNMLKRYDKSPKIFLRDSGLFHTLINRRSIADLRLDGNQLGHSWEGFCIEALVRAAPQAWPYFYRDDEQNEIDLVLDFGEDRRLAIEIKSATAKMSNRFEEAVRMVGAMAAYVVRPVEESFTDQNGRRVMTLREMIGVVRQAGSAPPRRTPL